MRIHSNEKRQTMGIRKGVHIVIILFFFTLKRRGGDETYMYLYVYRYTLCTRTTNAFPAWRVIMIFQAVGSRAARHGRSCTLYEPVYVYFHFTYILVLFRFIYFFFFYSSFFFFLVICFCIKRYSRSHARDKFDLRRRVTIHECACARGDDFHAVFSNRPYEIRFAHEILIVSVVRLCNNTQQACARR